MPRASHPRLRVVLVAALTTAAGAAAARPVPPDDELGQRIVIAGDPPPPPPSPPAPPPRQASIALASAGLGYASDTLTPLERFGAAGGLGLVHVSHRKQPGFEVLASATGGERGRSYAAAARMVLGPRFERADLISPFFAIGVGFAIARLDEGAGKDAGAGLGLGPSAALGLHGFLSPRIYWRASAGFVGAGIGTFSTDLGLGWVIGR